MRRDARAKCAQSVTPAGIVSVDPSRLRASSPNTTFIIRIRNLNSVVVFGEGRGGAEENRFYEKNYCSNVCYT